MAAREPTNNEALEARDLVDLAARDPVDLAAREPATDETLEARGPVDLAATVTETTPVGAGQINATELEAIVEIAGGQQVIPDEHAEAARVEKTKHLDAREDTAQITVKTVPLDARADTVEVTVKATETSGGQQVIPDAQAETAEVVEDTVPTNVLQAAQDEPAEDAELIVEENAAPTCVEDTAQANVLQVVQDGNEIV